MSWGVTEGPKASYCRNRIAKFRKLRYPLRDISILIASLNLSPSTRPLKLDSQSPSHPVMKTLG